MVGLPILAGLCWWLLVPPRVDLTSYKEAIFQTDEETASTVAVVYDWAIWPVVISTDISHLGSAGGLAGVSEPASGVLLAIGLVGCLGCWRRVAVRTKWVIVEAIPLFWLP